MLVPPVRSCVRPHELLHTRLRFHNPDLKGPAILVPEANARARVFWLISAAETPVSVPPLWNSGNMRQGSGDSGPRACARIQSSQAIEHISKSRVRPIANLHCREKPGSMEKEKATRRMTRHGIPIGLCRDPVVTLTKILYIFRYESYEIIEENKAQGPSDTCHCPGSFSYCLLHFQ